MKIGAFVKGLLGQASVEAPRAPEAPSVSKAPSPPASPRPVSNSALPPVPDAVVTIDRPKARVVEGKAAAAQHEAAKAEFSARYPGVKFRGVPNLGAIDASVVIEPGATIHFPEDGKAALALRGHTRIGATAEIKAPTGSNSISLQNISGGGVFINNVTITGGGDGALTIRDSEIEGYVSGLHTVSKCTVAARARIEGNGDVSDTHLAAGASISGLGTVERCTLGLNATKSGNGDMSDTTLGQDASVEGLGAVERSTLGAHAKKSGNGDMSDTTLENDAQVSGLGAVEKCAFAAGAQKSGNGDLSRSRLGLYANVSGLGAVDRSILEDQAEKSGNGDLINSRLGTGAKRSGLGETRNYDMPAGAQQSVMYELVGGYTTGL